MCQAVPRSEVADRLKATFQQFDANGNGTIEEDELVLTLLKLRPDFSEVELRACFDHADVNQDGVLQLDEFVSWMAGMDEELRGKMDAATKIQAIARGRRDRKVAANKAKATKLYNSTSRNSQSTLEVESGKRVEQKMITINVLWEALTISPGRHMTTSIEVDDMVRIFSECKRSGLDMTLAGYDSIHSFVDGGIDEAIAIPEDLSEAELAHICHFLIKNATASESTIRAEMEVWRNELRQKDGWDQKEGALNLARFKRLISSLSQLMRIDKQYVISHWHWFKTGRFETTESLLELMLEKCVARYQTEGSIWRRKAMTKSCLDLPFRMNDCIILCVNGGLVRNEEEASMTSAELSCTFLTITKNIGELLQSHEQKKGVAVYRQGKEPVSPGNRESRDHLLGRTELEILVERLFGDQVLRGRFSSPIHMVLSMVERASTRTLPGADQVIAAFNDSSSKSLPKKGSWR